MQLLERMHMTSIAELWLDHDLGGEDTIKPVIELLVDATCAGAPHQIGVIYVHTSNVRGAHYIKQTLRAAGYNCERVLDKKHLTW